MEDRTCPKCLKIFSAPCRLRSHLNRKKPCDTITQLQPEAVTVTKYICEHCNRSYNSKQSMNRHIRDTCKVAKMDRESDEYADTVRRHRETAEAQSTQRQIDELTKRLDELSKGVATPTTINNNFNVEATVHLYPWNSECPFKVELDLVKAIYDRNEVLDGYYSLEQEQQLNPKIAAPYTANLYLDIIKRTFESNPSTRNIAMNPARYDQVKTLTRSGEWATQCLHDIMVSLFSHINSDLTDMSCKIDTFDKAGGIQTANLVYYDAPDMCVKNAKKSIRGILKDNIPLMTSNVTLVNDEQISACFVTE